MKIDNDLDLVWGAAEIARVLNLRTERQAFRLLEEGGIPARKIGRLWVASRRKLREHFEGGIEGENDGAAQQ